LDISHFILSCNKKKSDLNFFFIKFKNLFKHYHISDASGLDGEGLAIGKGDLLRYKKILSDIVNNKDIKVIESWQGHLNNGLIFINDISKLEKIIK
jgi:N-acetylneuraminate synthase